METLTHSWLASVRSASGANARVTVDLISGATVRFTVVVVSRPDGHLAPISGAFAAIPRNPLGTASSVIITVTTTATVKAVIASVRNGRRWGPAGSRACLLIAVPSPAIDLSALTPAKTRTSHGS